MWNPICPLLTIDCGGEFRPCSFLRNTTPQWWVDHMQEVAPVEMPWNPFLSLFILVANITLLLLLFRLTVTRRIFQHRLNP